MKCWRMGLKRKLSLYVAGGLAAREVDRVEDHLLGCQACRARVARLKGGHLMARNLPRVAPQRDVWDRIEAAINAEGGPKVIETATARRGRRQLAAAMAALFLAGSAGAWIMWSGGRSSGEPHEALMGLDSRNFHPVAIRDIAMNTEPHVVAEGYVSEVRLESDGDMVFKLVEQLHAPAPFIICEILDYRLISPPAVGERVRVYGVSRFDPKDGHRWYEVHPVLNIEVVK
jgi:hypothetical protein